MLSLAMDTAAMEDLMAVMEVMVMADPMEDMEDMAMARGRLRPPLMLSLAMDTAAMADLMASMEVMVMADPIMEAMATESKSYLIKPAFVFLNWINLTHSLITCSKTDLMSEKDSTQQTKSENVKINFMMSHN